MRISALGVDAMDKFTRLPSRVEEKGLHRHSLKGHLRQPRPLSQVLTLALTGFYSFSRYSTLRMVLIYYAQVLFRWLLFTENKGVFANYIKKEGYLQM